MLLRISRISSNIRKENKRKKKLIIKFPGLKEDINKIIQDSLSVDPHFRSENNMLN